MLKQKWFLDLWFFLICPLAASYTPFTAFGYVVAAILIALSILWFALRWADFLGNQSRRGLIGQELK